MVDKRRGPKQKKWTVPKPKKWVNEKLTALERMQLKRSKDSRMVLPENIGTFGRMLYTWRVSVGLTQEALAARLNRHRQSFNTILSRYERNIMVPNLLMLVQIYQVLRHATNANNKAGCGYTLEDWVLAAVYTKKVIEDRKKVLGIDIGMGITRKELDTEELSDEDMKYLVDEAEDE